MYAYLCAISTYPCHIYPICYSTSTPTPPLFGRHPLIYTSKTCQRDSWSKTPGIFPLGCFLIRDYLVLTPILLETIPKVNNSSKKKCTLISLIFGDFTYESKMRNCLIGIILFRESLGSAASELWNPRKISWQAPDSWRRYGPLISRSSELAKYAKKIPPNSAPAWIIYTSSFLLCVCNILYNNWPLPSLPHLTLDITRPFYHTLLQHVHIPRFLP